jgi:hypothetical protein
MKFKLALQTDYPASSKPAPASEDHPGVSREDASRVHPGEQAQRHDHTGVTSDLYIRMPQHKQGLIEGFTKKYHV